VRTCAQYYLWYIMYVCAGKLADSDEGIALANGRICRWEVSKDWFATGNVDCPKSNGAEKP
jgi:hypothetical protein